MACNYTAIIKTYDANKNGRIEKTEADKALADWKANKITTAQALEVSDYYAKSCYTPVCSGSINVTQPASTSVWTVGKTHSIKWDHGSATGANVVIQLLKGGTAVLESPVLPNNGSTTVVTPDVPDGTNYQYKVKGYECSSISDTSSNFKIQHSGIDPTCSGSILVTNPISGANWRVGQHQTIRWTNTGAVGTNVNIDLYKGGSKLSNIRTNILNDGASPWVVPDVASATNYSIKVSSVECTGISNRTSNFEIKPLAAVHNVCTNNVCTSTSGTGTDECPTAGAACGTTPTHNECTNNLCTLTQGAGTDACTTVGSACGTQPTHKECVSQVCTVVSGAGTDTCATDSNCSVAETHNICVNGVCVEVSGAGTDECVLGVPCGGDKGGNDIIAIAVVIVALLAIIIYYYYG